MAVSSAKRTVLAENRDRAISTLALGGRALCMKHLKGGGIMASGPDLKPCPFCGAKPFLLYIPPHDHYIADFPKYEGAGTIECLECGAAMIAETEEKVIVKWNRRASDENA